ncbi:MAG TPA: hypothetical protein VF177_06650 [Anaerolineae bacterium]
MQGSRESQARERIGLRGVVKARRYSPRQNLDYVRLAFTSPRRLLEGFLLETSLLYGLVPFAIFVIAYEFLYVWNYLQQRPLAFTRLLPVPEQAYYLYQALFAPLINIADVLVFAGVLTMVAQLAGCPGIDTKKVTSFFMFMATFGLIAFVGDIISCVRPLPILIYLHPLVGLISLAYTTEFIHRQAMVSRGKSLAILLPAWVAYFLFRMVFFR